MTTIPDPTDARASGGPTGALTPAERETLRLVALLPLVGAATISRLSGLREIDSANRLLAALERQGLVALVRPPTERGRPARLWYPTAAGQALLAVDAEHRPRNPSVARRLGQRRLCRLLATLPLVEALHQVVGAVAAVPTLIGVDPLPGARPTLLDWWQPWRGIYYPVRDRRGRAAGIALHGAADLAWGNCARARILLHADLGTLPFGAWAAVLAGVLDYRDARRPSPRGYHDPTRDPLPAPPPLIVVTEDAGRQDEWLGALRLGAHERGHQPEDYAIGVHTRSTLDTLVARADPATPPTVRRAAGWGMGRVGGGGPGGGAAHRGGGPRAWRGEQAGWPDALVLRPREWRCLEVLARHPFLTGTDLATILGSPVNNVEVDRARLAGRGLLALTSPQFSRDGFVARGLLAELTVDGLRARARWEGLTLGQAVRWNGFVGGGLGNPVGDRARLARNMCHTRGVAAVVVSLYRAARRPASGGVGAAVLLWENAAACAVGAVQPDAHVRMAWYGATYEAVLEYDRGTEWRERWLTKARAWTGALASDLWHPRAPVIWVVTEGDAAERRIARLLGEAGRAWGHPLPVLLTTVARLGDDPDGPLGPVWRGLDDGSGLDRLCWLPPDGIVTEQ